MHDKQAGVESSYKEHNSLRPVQKLINMSISPCASVVACGAVRYMDMSVTVLVGELKLRLLILFTSVLWTFEPVGALPSTKSDETAAAFKPPPETGLKLLVPKLATLKLLELLSSG